MNYFKNTKNQIFAYDDEQVSQGYGEDLIAIKEEEKDLILNPPKTEAELLEIAKNEISNSIQALLDSTAQSLRYDDINSIGKYLGYDNAFRLECEALGTWSASVWVKAGEIESQIEDGTLTIGSQEEFLAMLPTYQGV